MSADESREPPRRAASGLRRFLWDGVLPEALGLCFVTIILAGFVAAYVVAHATWQKNAQRIADVQAQNLAHLLACSLGVMADEPRGAQDLLAEVRRIPGFQAVRWSTPDGKVEFAWPPAIVAVPGAKGAAPAPGRDPVVVADVPVRGADGGALGTLHLETRLDPHMQGAAGMLWNWGVAAVVTLLVFAAVYHRLRRHLRPIGAIERSLRSYAGGVERDLLTLTLSDSLGGVANDWNRLVGELVNLQDKLRAASAGGGSQSVLSRFESAVFRRIVDRLPFGVLCLGENDQVAYANQAAGALLGGPDEELAGRSLTEVVNDPAVPQTLAGVRARGGAAQPIDSSRKDGELETTLRFRILPLEGTSSREVLITIEDVGQLKEGERARDNFLYHVTHELRTPLTNIHAYAETLTKPGFDDEQTRKECYNVIISETRRLSRLVEDILSISQMEVGTARLSTGDVDLLRLLRQTVQDNLGGADEKHIDLTLALPPKVPKIQGDKQRLSVLLNNVIGNAVKYTPAEGKVQVRLEVDAGRVRIAVSDTGIGIAPEEQKHVFEKFYRVADDAVQTVSGTGLGLALAREVARLHGGDITLESEPGKGSTFTIELPAGAAEPSEVCPR